MARRRLPANVVEFRGNPSKLTKAEIEERRDAEVIAEPVRGAAAPAHLSAYARQCWEVTVPELEELELLATIDLCAFEMACEAYALARYALDEMRPKRADGEPDGRKKSLEILVVDTAHGGTMRKHPAFAVFNMAVNTYSQWCSKFGIAPLSRVTLRPGAGARGAGAGDRDDDDDFDFGT